VCWIQQKFRLSVQIMNHMYPYTLELWVHHIQLSQLQWSMQTLSVWKWCQKHMKLHFSSLHVCAPFLLHRYCMCLFCFKLFITLTASYQTWLECCHPHHSFRYWFDKVLMKNILHSFLTHSIYVCVYACKKSPDSLKPRSPNLVHKMTLLYLDHSDRLTPVARVSSAIYSQNSGAGLMQCCCKCWAELGKEIGSWASWATSSIFAHTIPCINFLCPADWHLDQGKYLKICDWLIALFCDIVHLKRSDFRDRVIYSMQLCMLPGGLWLTQVWIYKTCAWAKFALWAAHLCFVVHVVCMFVFWDQINDDDHQYHHLAVCVTLWSCLQMLLMVVQVKPLNWHMTWNLVSIAIIS